MARINKFASVNLNESYGKPDPQGGSAGSGSSGTSGSAKSRLPTQGGMLVLTRPKSATSTPKAGGRLGIPSTVNLPSLKPEGSGGDTGVPLAASPPLQGWTKGTQIENISAFKPSSVPLNFERLGLGRSMEDAPNDVKSCGIGKPNVYAPPALRALQASGGVPPPSSLPPTPLEKLSIPSPVIRGEEFPTLQASVARPPTPPQHQRQKDLQQKQRDKQQELKEQQTRLQELSCQHQKLRLGDPSQAVTGGPQLQPASTLGLLSKQEQAQKDVSTQPKRADPILAPGGGYGLPSFSRVIPSKRVDHGSSWTNDEREAGLSLRPQSASPSVQTSHSIIQHQSASHEEMEFPSLSIQRSASTFRGEINDKILRVEESDRSDVRRPYFPIETSRGTVGAGQGDNHCWLDGSREVVSGSDPHGMSAGHMHAVVQDRDGNMGNRSFGRDGQMIGKDDAQKPSFTYGRTRSTVGIGHGERREVLSGFNSHAMPVGNLHAAMPDRDLNMANRSVGKDGNLSDDKDIFSRDGRDSFSRDFFRDSRGTDNKETHARGMHARGLYSQGVNMDKETQYSHDNGHVRQANVAEDGFFHGREHSHSRASPTAFHPAVGHDAHYPRRYGSSGMNGDLVSSKDVRTDWRRSHASYSDPVATYVSGEGTVPTRTRSPMPIGSSFDFDRKLTQSGLLGAQSPMPEFQHRQVSLEENFRKVKLTREEGSGPTGTKSVYARDENQGLPVRGLQSVSTWKEDEKFAREEERKRSVAQQDLLETEEPIAQRKEMYRREGASEFQGVTEDKKYEIVAQNNISSLRDEFIETQKVNMDFRRERKTSDLDRETGAGWKEDDTHPRHARSTHAFPSTSWDFRYAGQEISHAQDLGLGTNESKFKQDHRTMRPESPTSWRKEVGNGPKSKLFSSPYVEGGSSRRSNEGGTYKLF